MTKKTASEVVEVVVVELSQILSFRALSFKPFPSFMLEVLKYIRAVFACVVFPIILL